MLDLHTGPTRRYTEMHGQQNITKNTDKIQQTATLYKYSHLMLQWVSQVLPMVLKISVYILSKTGLSRPN